MVFVEPCVGQLQYVYLQATIGDYAGQMVDLTQYCHVLRVYESVCKEYLTAQIIFYDNNNIIENMGISAGCSGAFGFTSPPNSFMYAAGGSSGGTNYGALQVLKMKGEQAPDSLKYSVYTVDLIGTVFYQNQGSSVNDIGNTYTPGTGIISQIWNEYLPADRLNILTSSMGLMGSTGAGHLNPGEKPLTAIHNVMMEMVSSTNQQLSNWLLFKNRNGVNLQQLPDMFSGIGPNGGYIPPPTDNSNAARGQQEYFVQKETWGASALPNQPSGTAFNDRDIYHAIISVTAEARQGSASGGATSGVNISSAGNLQVAAQDIMSGQIIPQGLTALVPNIGSLFSSITGGGGAGSGSLGGNQITNSRIWPNSMAPFTKTAGELGYSAAAKDAPQLVMKVPLQTGINVTVGKGIFAYLLPPFFGSSVGQDNLTGSWLVTDLVHELYTDGRQAAATTVMQLNQGPGGLAD